MKKRCVICDREFPANADRSDVVTCRVACRSKLHRQRQKAEKERKARLLSPKTESMMLWLQSNLPEAAHRLNKIRAIHGNEAFLLASEALQDLGRYSLKTKKK